MSSDQRHVLSVLVENRSGVLARIAGLFSGRGFNIASLSVGETVDPDVSRMTVVVEADRHTLEQVIKQLQKLVVTIKVEDFSERKIIDSELCLVKVNATPGERGEINDLARVFEARVVNITSSTMTLEHVGSEEEVDELINLLQPYGVKEIARTGAVALRKS